jgi:hypothetical protein
MARTVELTEQTRGLVQTPAGRGVAAPPVAIPPQRRKETHPCRANGVARSEVSNAPRFDRLLGGREEQEFSIARRDRTSPISSVELHRHSTEAVKETKRWQRQFFESLKC